MTTLPPTITGNAMDMLADSILQWFGAHDRPAMRDLRDLEAATGAQDVAGFEGLSWRDLSPAYLETLRTSIRRALATNPARYGEAHWVSPSDDVRAGLARWLLAIAKGAGTLSDPDISTHPDAAEATPREAAS